MLPGLRAHPEIPHYLHQSLLNVSKVRELQWTKLSAIAARSISCLDTSISSRTKSSFLRATLVDLFRGIFYLVFLNGHEIIMDTTTKYNDDEFLRPAERLSICHSLLSSLGIFDPCITSDHYYSCEDSAALDSGKEEPVSE